MSAGPPGTGEEREEAAIAWLVRLTSGEASLEDWRAHEAWLASDPANPETYARIEALWAEVDDHSVTLTRALDGAAAEGAVVPLATARRKPARRRLPALPWAAAAAAAALVVGAGGYAVFKSSPVTYQTAPGEIRPIALSDGTRVEMNGASRLSVRYGRTDRRVAMADAEAAFDVTKDPGRPFLITAGRQRIRVVGTAFDVVSHGGQVVVTVRRGVVEVARLAADGTPDKPTRVPAGYQLAQGDSGAAATIRPVDPDEAFAWRERRLVVRGQSLQTVASALNRAFAVPIEVRGQARDLRFTGVLVLDDEDAVVRRLQAFVPINVDRSKAVIVLSSRP